MKTLLLSLKSNRLIIAVYLSLFVLMIAGGIFFSDNSKSIAKKYDAIVDETVLKLRMLRHFREGETNTQGFLYETKFHPDLKFSQKEYEERLEKNTTNIKNLIPLFKQGPEKEKFEQVLLLWSIQQENRQKLFGLPNEKIIDYYHTTQKPAFDKFYQTLSELTEFIYEDIIRQDEEVDLLLNNTSLNADILIFSVVVLLVILGLLVFRNVRRLKKQYRIMTENKMRLRASELLYRQLFNNSPVFISVCELPTLRHLEVNEIMMQHYGYSKEELLSMTAFDLFPEEDKKILSERLKSVRGNSFSAIDRHIRKNGEIIDVEIRGHIIEHYGKKTALVIGVDVTEKLRAEEKIKQQEEFYRSITENSSDIQFVTDAEGKIIFASHPVFKNFGFTRDEIIGKSSKAFWHPQDFKRNKEKILELVENPGSSIQIETRTLDKNNCYHWCEAKITNQLHNPYINGFVSNYSDISERKEAVEKLKASEELYHSLFDKNPLPIFVVSKKKLQILEANETAVDLYGYSKEELLKMTVFDLRCREEWDSLRETMSHNDTENYTNYNVKHHKKNGEKIIVDVTIESIYFKGEVAYLGIIKDITKTVELQNQLNEEKISKQKEITRATIDGQEKERAELGKELHDNVNQILASAKLYLSCARSADADKKTELIEESTGLIDSGIQEIRKLSKSLVPPALNKSTLKESIEELVDPIRITTDKRIDTSFSLDESILCDRLKITIYRMIQEQMNNILKYAEASKISIVMKQDRYKLLLQIKDNGKGFDVKAKRKGIGLTNIANRAEVYNGKVVIDSAPGHGCTLSVYFPIEKLGTSGYGVISMTTPGMTA